MKAEKEHLSKTHPQWWRQLDKEKNPKIFLQEVTRTTTAKCWWRCDQEHSWESPLYNRVRGGVLDCPVCEGRVIVSGVNDFLTMSDEKLLKEIDYQRNLKEKILLTELHPGSRVKIWWRCDEDHSWLESPKNRSRGDGCPYCSGRRVTIENSIASTLHAKEYSPSNLKASIEVSVLSRKPVLWTCEEGHEFSSSPWRKIHKGATCPYCSNLKTLVGFNDLSITHPELAKEYSPTNLTPITEIRGNSSIVVEWGCSNCSHLWKTSVRNRGVRGDGCPNCSRHGTSLLEHEVEDFISSIYSGAILTRDKKLLNGKEVDLLLPEIGVGVEVNGDYWHSDEKISNSFGESAEERHEKKRRDCERLGVRLFFVWESDWKRSKDEVKDALSAMVKEPSLAISHPLLNILSKE